MFLYEVADALDKASVGFAIAGGYAVALHGAVRGTVDVDIILRLARRQFVATEAALNGLGLAPRLPVSGAEVFDFRREYIANRNMVAWSFSDPRDPTRVVDVIITHDLAKLKTVEVHAGGRTLPVLSLPDLIAMKKESGRPQDFEDIRALERLRP